MDVQKADIPLASFATADVGAIQASKVGEFFLRESASQAQLPKSKSEDNAGIRRRPLTHSGILDAV